MKLTPLLFTLSFLAICTAVAGLFTGCGGVEMEVISSEHSEPASVKFHRNDGNEIVPVQSANSTNPDYLIQGEFTNWKLKPAHDEYTVLTNDLIKVFVIESPAENGLVQPLYMSVNNGSPQELTYYQTDSTGAYWQTVIEPGSLDLLNPAMSPDRFPRFRLTAYHAEPELDDKFQGSFNNWKLSRYTEWFPADPGPFFLNADEANGWLDLPDSNIYVRVYDAGLMQDIGSFRIAWHAKFPPSKPDSVKYYLPKGFLTENGQIIQPADARLITAEDFEGD